MGLGMEIFESATYAMFALDLLDAGLDYGFVAQLAKNHDTHRSQPQIMTHRQFFSQKAKPVKIFDLILLIL